MTTETTAQQREAELDQELVDALAEALEGQIGFKSAERGEAVFNSIAPILAEIRRHAAADALREQSRSLAKLGAFMREQARAHVVKGNSTTAVGCDAMADTYYSSANKLTKAAADKIAEGYAFECAAFSQECETRVPDAGDYSPRHEPEDDEDPRWAE